MPGADPTRRPNPEEEEGSTGERNSGAAGDPPGDRTLADGGTPGDPGEWPRSDRGGKGDSPVDRALVEHSTVGVIAVDATGTVVRVNGATERFFGVDREALLGERFDRVVREYLAGAAEYPGQFVDATLAETTGEHRYEWRVDAGDGRGRRRIEHRTVPVESDTGAGGRLEYFTDVSDRADPEGEFRNEEFRRRLYRIASNPDTSIERKIRRMLALGRECLGVENGHLVTVDAARGRHEVVVASGSDLVREGQISELANTFCRRALTEDEPLGIYDASTVYPEGDPAAEQWGIACYLGGTVFVEDELFGTVCFVDRSPRERPFDGAEKAFVELVVRWVGHFLERRKHRRELGLKERAMDVAPIGIVITDPSLPDNPIVYANEGFRRVTGYRESEAIGRNCRFLQGEDTDPEKVAAMREAVDAGDPVSVELKNYRKDGTMFWNRVDVTPVVDESGDLSHFLGVQQDVTDRRERIQQLQVLERVLRHNLQNDMGVIRGYAELIHDEAGPPAAEWAAPVLDHCDRLLTTVDKQRRITAVLSERPDRARVDVAALVRSVVAGVREDWPDASVETDLPGSLTAVATGHLGQAVDELVDNAVRHGDRATPSVTVSVARRGDTVEVRIADDGPGIPEMERAVLTGGDEFGPLYHGSGLGLWLVYLIVRRSGGSVRVADGDPRGTVVTVELNRTGALDPSALDA